MLKPAQDTLPGPTPSRGPATPRGAIPQGFHVMLKPRGAICNLDCGYCYFLTKEALYPGSGFRMSSESLETFTRQYFEAQSVPEVDFGWQGGEPMLMGLDFFRLAVELQEKHRPAGMTVHNSLQTNGTLIDEEWSEFFRENDFLVGISLDGPRALHDAYRVDKSGAASFDRVMAGLALLKKTGVPFNVLTTVNAANVNYPAEVYRFLRDEAGACYIQFIPIVERENGTGFQEGHHVTDRSVGGRQYGEFLAAVFDEWVRRDVGEIFVQIFDVALNSWSGERPGLCIFDETCGGALAAEHNGDVYSCDHYVEPRYLLGNLEKTPLLEIVNSDRQRAFGLAKREALPRYCRECEVRFACGGGCPKDRFVKTPGGEPGLNYLCEGFRDFFNHIDGPMRFMAGELAARRPPANIIRKIRLEDEARLEREFARAGRNDTCPCGSGKKFKHCHGG